MKINILRIIFVLSLFATSSGFASTPKPGLPIPLPFDPLGLNKAGTAAPLATLTGGLNSFAAQIQALINTGVGEVLADAQAADSIASQPDPNSKTTPQSVLAPQAHMCLAGIPAATPPIPGLIAFLQSLPTVSKLPTPSTGTPGVLTTVVTGQIAVTHAQDFINNLASPTGPATQLSEACDAWIISLMKAPAALAAAANSNLLKLMLLLPKGL